MKHSFEHKRRSRGFTLVELLVVAAIIVVLAGVSFVAVINYQRGLNQVEKDGVAREIFIAAQNHLSAAESQGFLGATGFGAEEQDADGNGTGVYYYIVSADAADGGGAVVSSPDAAGSGLLRLMLPFASVDETVRQGGSYVIRYQTDPAIVLDVFYSTSSGRFSHSFSSQEYDTLISDYLGESHRNDRRNYNTAPANDNSVIGWYGGDGAERVTADESLKAPTLTYRNAERLQFFVTDPNYNNADASLTLLVSGAASGARMDIPLSSTSVLPYVKYDASTQTYTVTLDDVARQNGHFRDICGDAGFIPGENITVQVLASSGGSLVPGGSVTTNSLFGDATTTAEAEIANIRHLENLSDQISGLGLAADDSPSDLVNITAARQTSDLIWPDYLDELADRYAGTYSDSPVAAADTVLCSSSRTGTILLGDKGCYLPVSPVYYTLSGYDGQNHTIRGVTVNSQGAAGLFGALSGASETDHASIRDLTLEDFDIYCKNGSNTGALAGTLEHVDVSGVLVRNTGDDAGREITASNGGNAGGLVGSFAGGSIEQCAAAVYVRSVKGSAGGLVGSFAGGSVRGSYAGGHTQNGAYRTETAEDLTARVNVVAPEGSAGGLVGESRGVVYDFVYSTASAAGQTAGGLLGDATGGTVAHSYAVGLVQGTDHAGAVAGAVSGVALAGETPVRYYELVNEGQSAVGSGSFASGAAAALDENLTSYHAFITAKNYLDEESDAAPAVPYDTSLAAEFKNCWDMPTVAQLGYVPEDGTLAAHSTTHYGDWPSPETKVVNTHKLTAGGAEGTNLSAMVDSVSVIYDDYAGLPAGVSLRAVPLEAGTAEYSNYLRRAAWLLEARTGDLREAELLDLSIVKDGTEYQPGAMVDVELELADVSGPERLTVIHFGQEAELVPARLRNGTLTFEATGFSVYAILKHETDTTPETPRVTFHFLSPDYSESGGAFTAGPYTFPNMAEERADDPDYNLQTSQIVTSGEALEKIKNPPNKTNPEMYFYGWYIVHVAENGVAADGTVTYTWDEDPELILMEQPITIALGDTTGDGDGEGKLTWTINQRPHVAAYDAEGSAHVYLAPIYENYYFVNFHLADKEAGVISNSILARKLAVLGSDELAEVRIGDITAPSTDAAHKIFTGWSGYLWESGYQSYEEMTTRDDDGSELLSASDKDGYYMTVRLRDFTESYEGNGAVDLYPIFTEARWFYFSTGKSGNGATYVGAKYLFTTDDANEVTNGTAKYFLTELPTSRRTGFRFKGWYADPTTRDANGDWIDGVQITDENGRIVNTDFTKYANDDPNGEAYYTLKDGRLYVYKELPYADGVTFYAHWEEIDDTEVTVIVWKQKITDSKSAEDSEKTYDYEDAFVVPCNSGMTLNDLRSNDLLRGRVKLNPTDNATVERDLEDIEYTGFHYRTTEMSDRAVSGDKSTVVNIYYDRDLMTINFYYTNSDAAYAPGGAEPAFNYTVTTADDPEEQYGIVNGEYVRLTRRQGHGYVWSFRYSYTPTASDTIAEQYALVNTAEGNGDYVRLTRESSTVTNYRWRYRSGDYGTVRYMDDGRTDGIFYVPDGYHWAWRGWRLVRVQDYKPSGYTQNDPPPVNDSTQYYVFDQRSNAYYAVERVGTTTTTYTWKLGNEVWTGARYRRLASSEAYEAVRYAAAGTQPNRSFTETVGTSGTLYGLDGNNGHVELTGTETSAYEWYTTKTVEGYYQDNENDGLNGPVYGLVNGQYVELTPVIGDYDYATVNSYSATEADHDAQPKQYAIVDGEYVELGWEVVGTQLYYTVSYIYTPYTGTPSNGDSSHFGINNSQFITIYYNNGSWYRTRTSSGWFGGYSYSNNYSGTKYTRSSGGDYYYPADGPIYALSETSFVTHPGTNAQKYGLGPNGEVYQLGAQTSTNQYGWTLDGVEYTGARYVQGDGAAYDGERLTRSGGSAPYTYSATAGHEGDQYMLDGNGGHVALRREPVVSGYTYVDADGVTQSYPLDGDRYSYGEHTIDTPYTGPRYTRTAASYAAMVTWTGLYGQSFAQCGYSWNEMAGSRAWRDETGQGQTLLDAFISEYNPYNLTSNGAPGTASVYHYKQQLDGTYTQEEGVGRFTAKVSSNATFYFSDKFTGFKVATYNSGTNGFNENGGSSSAPGNSASTRNTLHVYHTRNSYDLTFNVNYPNLAGVEYSNGSSADRTVSVFYEQNLSGYGEGGANYFVPTAPDNYVFAGWYEDSIWKYNDKVDEGHDFNFNSPMPAANKVLYAKWTPVKFRIQVDPNGGVIDHINHSLPGSFRYDGINYNTSAATYFNAVYQETITEYANIAREYVEITDVEAAALGTDNVFYYVNNQYFDGAKLTADARNAIYITESEIDTYYNYYCSQVEEGEPLGISAWKNQFFAKDTAGNLQKYRKAHGGENYILMGWYRVMDDGSLSVMPYDFADVVTGPVKLRAMWRLDGGYVIRYVPEYTVPTDGALINGNILHWSDPPVQGSTYADGATTTIYRQPTELTVNGLPMEGESYIFRGWRLVLPSTVNGSLVYTPMEKDVYYDPGDSFTIHAHYSDELDIIYMQAVYEEVTHSYRRPEVTKLTLDANKAYFAGAALEDEDPEHPLTAWSWPGARVLDQEADQIRFEDMQSNAAIHLADYATPATRDGERSRCGIFSYDTGYLLIGFDEDADPRVNKYVPDVAADAVISLPRQEDKTVYAVWEPMVYLNIVNATKNTADGVEGGPVTFRLSSTDGSALTVVNIKEGVYDRTPLEDLNSITVEEGETLHLAIPYGALKNVTISGTNSLGTGMILHLRSELDGEERESTSAKNGANFSLTDTLEEHETGVTVYFTTEKADRTLVLYDNENGDGTGGGTEEQYYTVDDTQSEPLPRRERVGYQFLGWATSPTATSADYAMDSRIPNLDSFFGSETVRELYGVWTANAETNKLYVYKDVPEPGDRSKSFTFTIALSAVNGSSAAYTGNYSPNPSTFTLSHGQYALLEIGTKDYGTSSSKASYPVTVKLFSAGGTQVGSTKTIKWTATGNGKKTDLRPIVTIAESVDGNYTPALERAAATSGSESYITFPDDHTITWDNQGNSGGTVIYHNTRKTVDITILKELVDDPFNVSKAFSFTAAVQSSEGFTLEAGDASFSVSNGGEGHTIHGIPTGTVLTLTEAEDNNYATTAASALGTADGAAADNVFRFTVTENDTITFTNTLKKQKVKIVKESSVPAENVAGNMVEAQFTLTGGGLTLLSGKYTTPNNNLIYEGQLSVHDYRLNEDWVEDGYLRIAAPIALNVAPDGVTASGSGDVAVSGPDGSGVYTVTVTNRKTVNVTIAKHLVDPYGYQRQSFSFTLSATESDGVTPLDLGEQGGTFTLFDGQTKVLTLPTGIMLRITERANDNYTTSAVSANGAEDGDSADNAFLLTVGAEDDAITFTNTRLTENVVLRKVLDDPYTGSAAQDFQFTLSVRDSGHDVDLGENASLTLNSGDAEGVTLAIPRGAQLTVTESGAEDYTLEKVSGHGTVNGQTYTLTVSEGGDTAVLKNLRKTAAVTVSKTLADDYLSGEKAFEFTAALTDEAGAAMNFPGTESSTQTFTYTFTASGTQDSRTFQVPLGCTLTVTEREYSDYTTTVDGAAGRVGTVTPATQDPVTISFLNARDTVELQVVKVLTDPYSTGDQNGKSFSFTAAVSGGGVAAYTEEFSVAAGDSSGHRITVPNGAAVTVTENLSEADALKYSTTAACEIEGNHGSYDGDGRSYTLTANQLDKLTFTNTRNTTTVTVKKTLTDDSTDSASRAFQFTAALTEGSFPAPVSFTVDSVEPEDAERAAGYVLTVPVGDGVTLTETGPDLGNYSTSANGQSGKSYTLSNVTGPEAVVFHNARRTQHVTVVKELKNDPVNGVTEFPFAWSLDGGAEHTFNITVTQQTVEGETRWLGRAELSDLPVGAELVIRETLDDGATENYSTLALSDPIIGAYTQANRSIRLAMASPAGGGDVTVTFTNTRNWTTVTLRKTLSDPYLDGDGSFTFRPRVTEGGLGVDLGNVTVTLANGETETTTFQAPVGMALTVTELDADNYTVAISGDRGTGDGAVYTVSSLPAAGDDVTFTNTRKTAALTVSKTLTDAFMTGNAEFAFQIACDQGSADPAELSLSFTPAEGRASGGTAKTGGTVTVPVGVTVTVTETPFADGRYTVTGSASGKTDGNAADHIVSFAVTAEDAEQTIPVSFTNTRRTARVTVSKTLTDAYAQNTGFHFTASAVYDGATLLLNAVDAGFDITLNNGATVTHAITLPIGAVLTVTEDEYPDYLTTAAVNGSEALEARTATLTVEDTEREDRNAAAFANTRDMAQLRITKTLTDQWNPEERFTFTVTADGKALSQNGSFTLGDGEEQLVSVPVGAEVVITESGAHIDRYDTAINGTPSADRVYTIDAAEKNDEPVEVAFTNTRQTVTVTLEKVRVEDALSLLLTDGIDFRFQKTVTVDGTELENDTITLSNVTTSVNGETAFAVPKGASVRLEELDSAAYTTNIQVFQSGLPTGSFDRSSVDLTADGDCRVVFTNTRRTARVTLTKRVDGIQLPATETFGFRVKLEYVFKITGRTLPIALYDLTGSLLRPGVRTGPGGWTANRAIQLAADGSITLNIPCGLVLTIVEDPDARFETGAATANGTAFTFDAESRTFAMEVTQDETVTIRNSIQGLPVTFTKTDSAGVGLSGAEFRLYEDEACTAPLRLGGVDAAAESGDGGVVRFEAVPVGTYYLKETAAPEGYALCADEHTVEVNTAVTIDGQEVSAPADYRIVNDSTTTRKVILKKINPAYDALSGAEFELCRADGSVVATFTVDAGSYGASGANGAFYVGQLPVGTYYLHETKTPTTYGNPVGKTYLPITVPEDGRITTGAWIEQIP